MPSGEAEVESGEAEVAAAAGGGAQKANGPVEVTGPLAAGLLTSLRMIRYREAPTTGLEPEKSKTTNIMRDAGLLRFRLRFPRLRRI